MTLRLVSFNKISSSVETKSCTYHSCRMSHAGTDDLSSARPGARSPSLLQIQLWRNPKALLRLDLTDSSCQEQTTTKPRMEEARTDQRPIRNEGCFMTVMCILDFSQCTSYMANTQSCTWRLRHRVGAIGPTKDKCESHLHMHEIVIDILKDF